MTVLTRLASAVVVTGLLGVSMWLAYEKPHLDARLQDPLPNQGRFGRVVANRVFGVQVDRVDVARSLAPADPVVGRTSPPRQTPGIFVIVYLRVKSAQKPVSLGHVRLTTRDGLHYGESGRVGVPTKTSGTFEPMLWGRASYLFEIPRDQLAGLHLIVGEGTLLNQLSAEADIDLGISTRVAAGLLAHPADAYRIREG